MKRQIEKYDAKITADAQAEGLEQGRTAACQEIAAWNNRHLDAEAKGIPFNEPPPRKTEINREPYPRYLNPG